MKSFFACIFLTIIAVLIYGLVLKGIWGNPSASSMMDINEYSLRDRGRFLLIQNLVENRSFALTREQADVAAPDAGYYKGSWYLLYPPAVSIFAIPFYLIGLRFNLSLVASFAMGGLFAIGILIFIFLIARHILKLPYWTSILASLIFGFASTALGYTTSLFQHHATTFFIISSFYAVYQYKIHRTWGFLWGVIIWINYALIIFVDYPNALLMLPVMIYFFLVSIDIKKVEEKHKVGLRLAIILTSIFFVILTFLHGYYNYVNFGGWMKLSGSLVGFREGVAKSLDQGNSGDIEKKIDELAAKKKVYKFFKEESLVNGGYQLLGAPDRGLFVFSPIYILAILGIIFAFSRMDLEKGILISIAIVILFFYSSWSDPYGGWAFGPRYLIPAMPILALFVVYFLAFTSYKIISRLIAFLLLAFSAGVSVLGAVTTNAVPPKIEAIPLKTTYGLFFNLDFLFQNKTSNFFYNYFFHNQLSLVDYYMIIFGIVMWTFFIVLFILPLFSKQTQKT